METETIFTLNDSSHPGSRIDIWGNDRYECDKEDEPPIVVFDIFISPRDGARHVTCCNNLTVDEAQTLAAYLLTAINNAQGVKA